MLPGGFVSEVALATVLLYQPTCGKGHERGKRVRKLGANHLSSGFLQVSDAANTHIPLH
jgi:hypothetical protein